MRLTWDIFFTDEFRVVLQLTINLFPFYCLSSTFYL